MKTLGPIGPRAFGERVKEDYIGRKKTILMTSRHLRLSKLLQTKMVISPAAEV